MRILSLRAAPESPPRRARARIQLITASTSMVAASLALLLGASGTSAAVAPDPTTSVSGVPHAAARSTAYPAGLPVDDPAADPAGSATAGSAGPGTAANAPLDCTAPTLPSTPEPVIPAGLYGGHHLSDDQAHTAELVVAVGKAMGITVRGVRIALATAMMESSLHPWQVSGPYVGLFQQLADPVSGKYTDYDRTDPVGATRMFYQQLVELDPGYQDDQRPDWQIAERVQQTGEGKLFDGWRPLATELTNRFYDDVPPYAFYPTPTPTLPAGCATPPGQAGGGGFDAGNIISDAVFYNTHAMTVDQVRTFINTQGAACTGAWCLRTLRIDTPAEPSNPYCHAYPGGTNQDAAAIITDLAVACGINPQVMLVTLQKESGLLTRTNPDPASYTAAFGWHCPDTGPAGSAHCDPTHAGFFNQAYGMAQQWSRYRIDPDNYHYRAGHTTNIAWNVASTGCGSAPVHIANTATASLYNYTPYQPNTASLTSYPGTGDACSSYGNRNFYYLFTEWFGSTGGGSSVTADGVDVTIPASPDVPADLAGATITAPNAAVAQGLTAGLATLGTPYVWGGGTNGGPADQGCARGGGASNSCQGTTGFDCSGLTAYILKQAGYTIPGDSTGQRAAGTPIPWTQAQPGDIIGYPGHVAIYLGTINGKQYLLEAPYPGTNIHIRTVNTANADTTLHRYWR